MNFRLLILGNGFDLHCGLKSGYKDFFRNEILDTSVENYGIFRTKQGSEGFWEKLMLEYFKANRRDDYNWCDVEAIIKETLLLICFGKGNTSADVNTGLWRQALNITKWNGNPKAEAESREYIDKPIIKYLFVYCAEFFYAVLRQRKATDEEMLHLLMANLLQQLHIFERRFCKYIKDNISDPRSDYGVNTEYVLNAVNLLNKIAPFTQLGYDNINRVIHKEEKEVWKTISPYQKQGTWKTVNVLSTEFSSLNSLYILSFNYTALFDILEVQSPCVYGNVHGKLCNASCADECKSSSVIFGIDDTLIQSQSANTQLRLFSKTYRKMSDTSAPVSVLPPNAGNKVEIKFYGHSLSEADYSYFQSIFDYYNLYGNNNVRLTFYYSKGYEQNDAIYRLINTYGKTLSNREQGKNLMHKLLLENRLKTAEI